MKVIDLQQPQQQDGIEYAISVAQKPKWWENQTLFGGVVAGLFLIMLLLNFLTFMHVDDYAYCFSFANKERIDSVLDIFPSMARHAQTMNGRVVAHFFVQLFLMMPKFIFNIVNASIFMLELWFIYRMANHQKPRNAMLFFIIACLIWYFTPAFGQTNLWLDGSCNYLWGVSFAMVCLYPYYRLYIDGTYHSKALYLLPLFSFIVGAYSENHSFAAIVGILGFAILINNPFPSGPSSAR